MSFALSFSERFYITEDCDSLTPEDFKDNKRLPTTVYQAILAMKETVYVEMCLEVFGCVDVDCDVIMDKIRETDTCSDLSSPVCVWIDEEGYFTIDVYDQNEDDPWNSKQWRGA